MNVDWGEGGGGVFKNRVVVNFFCFISLQKIVWISSIVYQKVTNNQILSFFRSAVFVCIAMAFKIGIF